MPRPGGGGIAPDLFKALKGYDAPGFGSNVAASLPVNSSSVNTAVKPAGDLAPQRTNLIADPNSATDSTMGSTLQRKNLLGS